MKKLTILLLIPFIIYGQKPDKYIDITGWTIKYPVGIFDSIKIQKGSGPGRMWRNGVFDTQNFKYIHLGPPKGYPVDTAAFGCTYNEVYDTIPGIKWIKENNVKDDNYKGNIVDAVYKPSILDTGEVCYGCGPGILNQITRMKRDSGGGVLGSDPGMDVTYRYQWDVLPNSDSLWTETPAIKDASTAAVTVGEEFTTSVGRLKAIKFWKNETAGNYVVTLWHPNGASLFSQQYKSTTTGWQKITMDLPLEAGIYVIGVYFPNGKYVYTNGLNPRTRTNLTGNKGLFSGGNSKPSGSYTASFFVDAVIEYSPTVPLSVKTSPDREATMPKDSVGVSATATGYTKFQWTVEDFEGRFTLKDTNTLKPYVIPLDSSGCRVWLFCTVTDAGGNQLADAVAIRVAPHPKMVMGYYLIDGSFKWRVPPTFIEFPQPATYVRP